MAVITINGQYTAPYLTSEPPGNGAPFVELEPVEWPMAQTVIEQPIAVWSPQSTITNNLPIEVESWTVPGGLYRWGTYFEDLYNRIHVNPVYLDLGNLLSDQVRVVEIWNAYPTGKLLTSIEASGTDGMTLVEPEAAPSTFAAYETRQYLIEVSTNGAPVIGAYYIFNFPDETPIVVLEGRRVTLWPFVPQIQHSESLEWKTDIIPSFNLEQRLALRAAPRQSFTYEFQLEPHEFSRAKAIATQWAHRVYGIPVWSEATPVGNISFGSLEVFFATGNADYRNNDLLYIWQDAENVEAVEIDTVLSDRVTLKLPTTRSFTGAHVAPCRFVRTFEGMTFSRGAHTVTRAKARFQVTQNVNLSATGAFDQYRGKDVLTTQTVMLGELKDRIVRATDEFDNGQGAIAVDITSSWVTSRSTITFDTSGKAERWAMREWLHSRYGRQKAFWLPSWNADLTLLSAVSDVGTTMEIRAIGWPLYYGEKDIMIQLKNGTRIYCRALSAAVNPSLNEVLELETPTGVGFTPADVDLICFLSHARLDADRVEITHTYAGRAFTTIPTVETPE